MKSDKIDKIESPITHYKKMADGAIILKIFKIIEQNPRTSQKKITMQTGLTAGLVHSFMRMVINKGWIRAKQVNTRRWLYFLTPEGFIEKSNLTMRYLSKAFNNYRTAQKVIESQLVEFTKKQCRDLVVIGETELAEIAVLNILASKELNLVGFLSSQRPGEMFLEYKMSNYESLAVIKYDKILVFSNEFYEWQKTTDIAIRDKDVLNMLDKMIIA